MANVSNTIQIELKNWGKPRNKKRPSIVDLEELLNGLSKKQKKAAADLLKDLVAVDLHRIGEYDPEDDFYEARARHQLEVTGGAIQAAYLGKDHPGFIKNVRMGDKNYSRLKSLFEKWPEQRQALYIFLINAHEAKIRHEQIKEPINDFWEKYKEIAKGMADMAASFGVSVEEVGRNLHNAQSRLAKEFTESINKD